MSKDKGLSPQAYQIMDGDKYHPYVPSGYKMPEVTIRAIILGIVLGIIFAAANAYLGLKVGMTVTASIPVSVISMGILRGILKKGTILENNTVQTVGSAGESLAAGIIFTIPALIMMNLTPNLMTIFLIACLGGLLGVLMMIPLRRYLIVKEHGKLPYPEGTGCAEVLVAGEEGGAKVEKVFAGLGIGALYKFFMDGSTLGLWKETAETKLPFYPGARVGMDVLPSLLGVGYIIGPRISAYMLSGGILAWLVLIPLIAVFGQDLTNNIYPATDLIKNMDAWDIWDKYIRYIGAGAVAFGGILSLIKALPTVWESFRLGFKEMLKGAGSKQIERTKQDLPMWVVLVGSLLITILLWLLPQFQIGFIGALLVVLFTFFFTTVSSRVVGLIGGSSLPISGMTIAALLGTSVVFTLMGNTGPDGKFAAIVVGAIICVGISCAADISQDLKTGFLVGATPRKQQISEVFGTITSALIIGLVVMILHNSFTIGSKALPAPQATMMKMVVEGVMDKTLPWNLVLVGVFISITVELFGFSSLPFAVGLYLPFSLSTPIMLGGLVRWWIESKNKGRVLKEKRENGVLYGSGLIAGEATLGVFLALYISMKDRMAFLKKIPTPIIGYEKLGLNETNASILSLIMMGLLTLSLFLISNRFIKKKEN